MEHPLPRRRYEELVAREEGSDLAAIGDEIDWTKKEVNLDVDRQRVKDSPVYDASITIDRAYDEKFRWIYGINWVASSHRLWPCMRITRTTSSQPVRNQSH